MSTMNMIDPSGDLVAQIEAATALLRQPFHGRAVRNDEPEPSLDTVALYLIAGRLARIEQHLAIVADQSLQEARR